MSARPDIERAVRVLRRGGLVAFPTETVYGLGADATDDDALRRLYAVKGRPPSHPVIVHLPDADLEGWTAPGTEGVAVAARLAAEFWPGPLTVVVAAGPRVSRLATGGRPTVGLRVPAHPVAAELLTAFGGGIAAPSANRFGRVSPTTAAAVVADLGSDVDVVLDGGPCAVGVESTIVDCTGPTPTVLRAGAVTRDMLAAALDAPVGTGGTTPAPGTLPAHYAPDARVELAGAADLGDRIASARAGGATVALLGPAEVLGTAPGASVLAAPADAEEYARVLYRALWEADDLGVDVIVAVPPASEGIGIAVADRLRRAAAGR